MNQEKNKKAFAGAGKWDAEVSTYKHKIYLTNNKIFTGYSKGQYQNEPADKTVCLERVITRLTRSGYLNPHRVKYIEFFFHKVVTNEPEVILTLLPEGYIMGNNIHITTDYRLEGFLKMFYKELNMNGTVTKNIVHKPVLSTEEEKLNPNRKRANIKCLADLHAYIIDLMETQGFNQEAVMNFYRNYSTNHFAS